MPKITRKKPAESIAFKLDHVIFKKLARDALSQRVSVHSYARALLLEYLAEEDLREEIAQIKESLMDLNQTIIENQEEQIELLTEIKDSLANQ